MLIQIILYTQALKFAFKSILSRKSRSILTCLGIMIGVAGVLVIMSIGEGAQSLILSQVTKLGSNLVGILPGKSDESGPPAAAFGLTITTLTVRDVESLRLKSNVPNLEDAVAVVRGIETVRYKDKDISIAFSGVEASYTDVNDIKTILGRSFTAEEERRAVPVVVLGYNAYQQLFTNGEDPLGKIIKVKNNSFEVIGVFEEKGVVAFQNQDKQVYIPLSIAQKQILGINYLQFIRAKIDKPENIKIAIEDIKRTLRTNHNIKSADEDDFSVRDLADALKILDGITSGLKIFLAAMASISLVVGGIGIMNIMLVSVKERTKEIGLRKALGARASAIRNQFLLEASILTLFGGIVGIFVGVVISYLIGIVINQLEYDWLFVVPISAVVLSIGVSVFTGIFFGYYPAVKASKLDPIDALRYE